MTSAIRSLATAALVAIASIAAHAAPPAGTVIGNQATATYNDVGGAPRTATSNLVQTTVSQVKSFQLAANGSRTAAPGQTVYYPHTITNTGNGIDTYALNAPASTNFAAAGAGHGSPAYYLDANGDGVPDNATPITTSGPIAAGGVFRFVVAGTVPATAASGNTADLVVSVSDTTPSTQTNTDTTTVASSVITVTKALSSNSGPGGVTLTVTLSYTNTGTATANNVQITDTLPAGMTYVNGQARWSASGAAALTEANDGVEQAGFPPGIDFRHSGGLVTAIIPSVAAGVSGNVTFQVTIGNVAPQIIGNTAQYTTQTQTTPATTNVASYQVLQTAAVVANGAAANVANGNAVAGSGEPVTIGSAAAGASISFANYIWNLGNGTDTFDITIQANNFPAGHSVQLLQQDGATTLINSGGGAAADTGPIPGRNQACPAPLVTDGTYCGYRVVVRVTLPTNAANGVYSITKRATSAFNNAVFDDVTDTLSAVTANTVDVTNDRAAPPAGAAVAGDGLGPGSGAVIRTVVVAPAAGAATATRFQVWITNTGAVADSFNLAAIFAATTAAGVTAPTLPAGWSVALRADGGAANCSTVGAAVTSTGALAANAARLVCAEVTTPAAASGSAIPGTYDFDFRATSATNAAVVDTVRDRVTVSTVRSVTFTPNNTQQTFPGGTVTYSHTIANAGNAADTVSFAAGCLADSRAAQGWTSAAYIDANGNGVLDLPPAGDTAIACGATALNLAIGESRTIFVRAFAPPSAAAADPANVTTLTGAYSVAVSVTDTTSVTDGLLVQKEQQALGIAGCANNNPPAAGYTSGAIAASAATIPGACIAYRVTLTNATAGSVASVAINDIVPANAKMSYGCSGNGSAAPSVTVGAIAGTTPADNASGTVTANVGTLASTQQATLYFCVKIDAAPPAGTPIPNQATASGLVGAVPIAATSNAVTATVGAAAPVPPAGFSAVLAADTYESALPGATVVIAHTLANTGAADSYTLSATDLARGFSFTSVTLHPDANGDGQPDGAAPLANPVALAAGQVLRFVARIVIPANAPVRQENSVRIGATSAAAATIDPIRDTVSIIQVAPRDCGLVAKWFSRERGPSPAGPVTVSLTYYSCDKPRSKLTITDVLPAGMRYVPGSGRWSGTGSAALSDAVIGADREGAGASRAAYDYDVTLRGAVTATVFDLPAETRGAFTFDVEVAGGLAPGTVIPNTAFYAFYDAGGNYGGQSRTDTVNYLVTGSVDVELIGQRLPTAAPGASVDFVNVLTNRGNATDVFDITVGASTFPAGTTFALLKSDAATPLADTDGNGVPDTGPVAAGASYSIVLRARIPESAPPAVYKVTKVARSATAPVRAASADDVVDTLARRCVVAFDPDQQSKIGRGQHVTYVHHLTNRGNCTETVQAMLDYLGDSRPGWTSSAHVDNAVAGGRSIPGTLDPTDARIERGWSATLQPGEAIRILVDVLAPMAKDARAKAIVDSNVTTLVIDNSASGALTVRDTTIVDDLDQPAEPDNAIRNFADATYAAPTPWAVVGAPLWLRANAQSCNASPDAVDSRAVVITGPGGEREELTAVETGANTGIFTVAAVPVRAPPAVAGNGTLEGRANDVFEIEMLGCGRRIDTVVTLMEPVSVVFDSRTNEPVAGARVTLAPASGGQCLGGAVALGDSAANPVTTGSDGHFSFPPAAGGSYCLRVTPPNGYRFASRSAWTQLPPGRNLHVTGLTSGGSYGDAFALAASGLIVIDIPLDPTGQDGLFVQKDASRRVAEVGEFVDYTVRVKNGTGNVLDRADVMLFDDLPAGFAYVAGSVRRDGRRIAEPAGGQGPRLTVNVGRMERDEQAVITYRVRIGAGALQGDGTNRVQAAYTASGSTSLSNVAAARVSVTGGVFTDKGFILGKVFMDCNANGVQDAGERGVPGVRLVMEDGTFVATDGAGKFSFYGVSNRTHVVKADRASLPAGARLAPISARNLGDGASRIVDLKSGEMHRADFAIAGCDAAVVEEVKKRAEALARRADELALAGIQLATEARAITDPKALPASGVVDVSAPNGAPSPALPGEVVVPAKGELVVPAKVTANAAAVSPAGDPSGAGIKRPGAQSSNGMTALEDLVPSLDNTLGFVGLADGDTLPAAQSAVRVKGTAGATLELSVNGVAVPAARVGKRSVLQDKQVQAWEYIGVDLRPGDNTLLLVQTDAFGNERGRQSIRVVAPGNLAKIAVEVPAEGTADGKSAVKVVVKLADARGVPVTARTPVTLETSHGAWDVQDIDPTEPDVQVMIEGGEAAFALTAPVQPGLSIVRVASGKVKGEARLHFMPELRSMIAAGVIEGAINLRKLDPRSLVPARRQDGFEQELAHLSRSSDDGRREAGARAAFFLKGKVRGEYLLTAAYDSDKDTRERLFRDIQPDEFYPVYGDSAVRGYDAQSTARLYLRVDHRKSYLLYGDFNTLGDANVRRLSAYSRSLTGARHHYENGRVQANFFASRDSTRQKIDEIRANGTSGPYLLSSPAGLVNSEKVEILTYDRDRPSLVLQSAPQARFYDYEMEPLTGRLLFKAPVPSVDANLNPVVIRVTYEIDQGGPQFWVFGGDAEVKVTERIVVGASFAEDRNPADPFKLRGAHAVVRLGERTTVAAEFARTERPATLGEGDAGRIHLRHDGESLKAEAFVARTDPTFDNPGAYLGQGRGEAGARLTYQLDERTALKGEALRTEDTKTGNARDGYMASFERTFGAHLKLELALRHAREVGGPAIPPSVATAGSVGTTPNEVTSVRARVTARLPGVQDASVYGEAEVDVEDADRKVLAVGGDYALPNRGKLYLRHEFISSLTGPYGLNEQQRQNTTVLGIDTEYMKDARLFSEYRIRDAIAGGDAEAAIGLRNLWTIAPGWRLGTTFERVHAISGGGQNENTALALGLEYVGSPLWKGSTRLELRDAATSQSLLHTVGFASRLGRDWTFLGRNALSIQRNKGGERDGAERLLERLQAGVAFRDADTDKWNALARIEHREERDDTQAGVDLRRTSELISIHADFKLSRPFMLSARYAAKWTGEKSNGISSRYRAQLVGGRATWEFSPRWDVGLAASGLFGERARARQYALGLEVGYLLATNLWLSAGYNVFGYQDEDLAAGEYTNKGAYIRLRYKFDEALLGSVAEGKR